MDYEDKYIECVDCGQEFVHSADDQARYEARGLQNDPKRCPGCREAKRARGGKDRGTSRGGNSRSRSPEVPSYNGSEAAAALAEPSPVAQPAPAPQSKRQERSEFNWPDPKDYNHEVRCTGCGKETTVPFKPAENQPVYCRDCFVANLPSV